MRLSKRSIDACELGNSGELTLSKRAANYVEKRKEESGNITYIYSKEHIEKRNKGKMKRLKKLNKSLSDLRAKVRDDLKSDDPKVQHTALAVALIDETYERVGNPGSAKEMKHYGVTTWMKKHFTFSKGKYKIKYVGKSGVDQEKEVSEKGTVSVLKELLKDKKDSHKIFEFDDYTISAGTVNDYLKKFKISAKDIRGLHANEEMRAALKEVRKGRLPSDEKDKEKKLKEEFKEALEIASGNVGHEPNTLKNQYLIPTIEPDYLKDGRIGTLASKKFKLFKRADEVDESGDENLTYERAQELATKHPTDFMHIYGLGSKYSDLELLAAKNLADQKESLAFFHYRIHDKYPEVGRELARDVVEKFPKMFFNYNLERAYPEYLNEAVRNIIELDPSYFFRSNLHETYPDLALTAAKSYIKYKPYDALNFGILKLYPQLERGLVENFSKANPLRFLNSPFRRSSPKLAEKAANTLSEKSPGLFFSHRMDRLYPQFANDAAKNLATYDPHKFLTLELNKRFPELEKFALENKIKESAALFLDSQYRNYLDKYPDLKRMAAEKILQNNPSNFFHFELDKDNPDLADKAYKLVAEYKPRQYLANLDGRFPHPKYVDLAQEELEKIENFSTLVQENREKELPVQYVIRGYDATVEKRQLPNHGEVGNWVHVVNVNVDDLKDFIGKMKKLDAEIAASDSEDLLFHTRERFFALSFHGPAVAVFDEDVYSSVDRKTGRRMVGDSRGAERTEAWINPSKMTLTSVITNVPEYAKLAEEMNITVVFANPESLIAPAIEEKSPDYREKFYQKWNKETSTEEEDSPYVKRTRELGFEDYVDDNFKLSSRKTAQEDPARRTADSLYKIIEFAFYRVPPKERKRFLSRLRGKVIRLNPTELSVDENKPDSAINQSMSFAKGLLAGLNPAFVQKVLAELTHRINSGMTSTASFEVGELDDRDLLFTGPLTNGKNNVPQNCIFTSSIVRKLEKTGYASQSLDYEGEINGMPIRATGSVYVINDAEDYRKLQSSFPLSGFPVIEPRKIDYVAASQYYTGIHVTENAKNVVTELNCWKPNTTAWLVMGSVKPVEENNSAMFLSKREFSNSVDANIVGRQVDMALKIGEGIERLSKRDDLTIRNRDYDENVLEKTFVDRISYQKNRLVKTAAEKHGGAMLAIMTPPSVVKEMKKLKIIDKETVSADGLHTTLIYLGKAKDLNKVTIDAIRKAAEKVCAKHAPLDMCITGAGVFAPGDDGTPVYVVPNAFGLSALQADLEGSISNLIDIPSRFGWSSHMTVGYSCDDTPELPEFQNLPEWTADKVRLQVGGEKVAEFALGGKTASLKLSKRAGRGRNSYSKCMECDKNPTHECIWADGRARAWFCDKHWNSFKKSNSIVKDREVENGAVTKNYGEESKKSIALSKRSQDLQPITPSPNIVIEPFEPAVQNAVNRIKSMDSSIFNNVTKIVVHPGTAAGQLGHVEMGPGKDPREIHLFRDRISQIVQQQMGEQSDPKAFEDATERAIVEVITHEIGHIGRNRTQEQILQQPFHGENEAERQSEEFMGKMHCRDFPLSKRDEQDNQDSLAIVKQLTEKTRGLQTGITPTPGDKPFATTMPGVEPWHAEIGNNPMGIMSIPMGIGGGGR